MPNRLDTVALMAATLAAAAIDTTAQGDEPLYDLVRAARNAATLYDFVHEECNRTDRKPAKAGGK
jgi:hypothetical protein